MIYGSPELQELLQEPYQKRGRAETAAAPLRHFGAAADAGRAGQPRRGRLPCYDDRLQPHLEVFYSQGLIG